MSNRNGYLFEFSTNERLEQYYHRARRCYVSLLEPCIFEYPEVSWDKNKIQNQNQKLLNHLPTKGNGVVYMIHLRNNEESGIWRRQYVGSSENPRERIKQHLIKCSKSTESCLDLVKEAVSRGENVGISWIKIKPSFFRIGIEQMIIGIEKIKDENALPWNGLRVNENEAIGFRIFELDSWGD